jgi:hypothetical protein
MLSCSILSSNTIVKLTALVIARRVSFFLPRDPIVCDTLSVFEQPDTNDKEVVPKEPQALRHILTNDVDELVAEPALLILRPAPARVTVCQTSSEFDRIVVRK